MNKILVGAAVVAAATAGVVINTNSADALTVFNANLSDSYSSKEDANFSWDTVDGAMSYVIYMHNRATGAAFTNKLVYTTTTTSANIYELTENYCQVATCAESNDWVFAINAVSSNGNFIGHTQDYKIQTITNSEGSYVKVAPSYPLTEEGYKYNAVIDFGGATVNGGALSDSVGGILDDILGDLDMSDLGIDFGDLFGEILGEFGYDMDNFAMGEDGKMYGEWYSSYNYYAPDANDINAAIANGMIVAPEGKVYDGVMVNGARVPSGEPFLVNGDTEMVYLWKDGSGFTLTDAELGEENPETIDNLPAVAAIVASCLAAGAFVGMKALKRR